MQNKHSFITRFIEEVIEPMSNREYQERVWVKGEGSECDSFDETINDFDYFMNVFNSNYKEYGLTREEFILIKNLENKTDEYLSDMPMINNDADIVNDPKWQPITALALEIYKKLTNRSMPSR